MFLFGLTAAQAEETRGWYDPHWHHQHDPETRSAGFDRVGFLQSGRAGRVRSDS
jgi:hypothetical protein